MTVFNHFDRLAKRSLRLRAWTFAVYFATLFAASEMGAQDEDKVVRVDTELAVFEVSVIDKNGKPVPDISPDDLQIFEDGVERPIEFFQPIRETGERRPLALVFALDVSGSMTPEEMQRLKTAMQVFVLRLADFNSYFAVVAFAMDVRTIQSFTNKPDKLRSAFEKLERNDGGLSTHAYDAVDAAVRLLRKSAPKVIRKSYPKRAIILISDGFPVGDVVGPATVIERAQQAETSVFAVILPSYSNVLGRSRPVLTPLELSGLVEGTGGTSYYANAKNFDELFRKLSQELTSSYAVAFYPASDVSGRTRNVRIVAKKGYTVRQNRSTFTVR